MNKLKYKKNDVEEDKEENTRFYMKLFQIVQIVKKRQKIQNHLPKKKSQLMKKYHQYFNICI